MISHSSFFAKIRGPGIDLIVPFGYDTAHSPHVLSLAVDRRISTVSQKLRP